MTAKKRAKPKANTGRPSAYEARFDRMAYRHTLLGATDKDLAKLFEVTEKTLNTWKQRHPTFLQSLKAGKDEADANVTVSLYRRARGYSHPAVKIFCSKDGKVTEVPYIERYPPDSTALIFWLKNRRPEQWRDKTEVTHKLPAPVTDMKDEDLLAITQGRGL